MANGSIPAEKRRMRGTAGATIGVIADTHGRLDQEVLDAFAGVSAIVHAGDVGEGEILERLSAIAPVYAVAGNNDGFHIESRSPRVTTTDRPKSFEIAGLHIYLAHMIGSPGKLLPDVKRDLRGDPPDVVVFGHSHLPHDQRLDGMWFFNPASAGPRRFSLPRAIGFLEKTTSGWRGSHVALDERSEEALARTMNSLGKNTARRVSSI